MMGSNRHVAEGKVSELAQVFEELKRLDLSPKALRERLQPFLDRRADAVPLLLRQFETEDEKKVALATAALRTMDDPSLVPLLLKLLQNSRVSDLAKGLILNLLEHYGLDTHDPSLVGASIDLEKLLRGTRPPQGLE